MKIGMQDIAGTEVEVHADIHGRWTIRLPATPEDENKRPLGYDENLDAALGQARRKLAKSRVQVDVPFVTIGGERGSAYGVHASNGDVLARVGGKAERIGQETVLKGETPKTVTDRIAQLENQRTDVRRDLRQLTDEWKMDLRAAVEAAIAAKQAESEGGA